jgi:predicted small lipoprotein YifL
VEIIISERKDSMKKKIVIASLALLAVLAGCGKKPAEILPSAIASMLPSGMT